MTKIVAAHHFIRRSVTNAFKLVTVWAANYFDSFNGLDKFIKLFVRHDYSSSLSRRFWLALRQPVYRPEFWILNHLPYVVPLFSIKKINSKRNLGIQRKFHWILHSLQVGTLDQLVGLSDDLGKLDAYVENITRKVATYLGEVLEDQRDKLHENLLANNSK